MRASANRLLTAIVICMALSACGSESAGGGNNVAASHARLDAHDLPIEHINCNLERDRTRIEITGGGYISLSVSQPVIDADPFVRVQAELDERFDSMVGIIAVRDADAARTMQETGNFDGVAEFYGANEHKLELSIRCAG